MYITNTWSLAVYYKHLRPGCILQTPGAWLYITNTWSLVVHFRHLWTGCTLQTHINLPKKYQQISNTICGPLSPHPKLQVFAHLFQARSWSASQHWIESICRLLLRFRPNTSHELAIHFIACIQGCWEGIHVVCIRLWLNKVAIFEKSNHH